MRWYSTVLYSVYGTVCTVKYTEPLSPRSLPSKFLYAERARRDKISPMHSTGMYSSIMPSRMRAVPPWVGAALPEGDGPPGPAIQ